MIVTRIRPTPYADMHCGHAWVAWHCWSAARESGGKFIVIFDDLMYQFGQLWSQSWSLKHAIDRYIEDLTWLGLEPDVVDYLPPRTFPMANWHEGPPKRYAVSTLNAEAHYQAAVQLGLVGQEIGRLADGPYLLHEIRQAAGFPTAPGVLYHPWLVMVRVVDDYELRVTDFYRGNDLQPGDQLRSEAQLYDYLWRRLYGGTTPAQSYIRHIKRAGAPTKESKSNVGGISIRDLRMVGYEPSAIIGTLREQALRTIGREYVEIPKGISEVPDVRTVPLRTNFAAGAPNVSETGFPWFADVEAATGQIDQSVKKARRVRAKAAMAASMVGVEKGEDGDAQH